MRGLNASAERVKEIVDWLKSEDLRRVRGASSREDPDRPLRFRTGAIESWFQHRFGGSRAGVHVRVADGLRRLYRAGLISKVRKGVWETAESYSWSAMEWVFNDTQRALAGAIATLETNPFLSGHGHISGTMQLVWRGHAPQWARSSQFLNLADHQPIPATRQAMLAASKLYSKRDLEEGHRLQRSVSGFLHKHPEWGRYILGEILGEVMAHVPCVILAYPERVLTRAEAESVGLTDLECLRPNDRLRSLLETNPSTWSQADKEALRAVQERMVELQKEGRTLADRAKDPLITQFYTFQRIPVGNSGPVAMGLLDRTSVGSGPRFLKVLGRRES